MFRWSILSVCLILGGITGLVGGPLLLGHKPVALLGCMTAPKDAFSYRDIVKKVLPAVVSIETQPMPVAKTSRPVPKEQSSRASPQLPENSEILRAIRDTAPGSSDQFRSFRALRRPPFEFPEAMPHHGRARGFVVDPKGVILTNNHVVQGAKEVVVRLEDGRHFVTKEIKTDPKTDLAIVRSMPSRPCPTWGWATRRHADRRPGPGPRGSLGLSGSVTAGIISAKGAA